MNKTLNDTIIKLMSWRPEIFLAAKFLGWV